MDPVGKCIWGSALLDAIVAAAVCCAVLRSAGPRLQLSRVLAALMAAVSAAGVVGICALFLSGEVGANSFGLMHIVYLSVALAPAATGLVLLLFGLPRLHGRARWVAGGLVCAAFVPAIVCTYASFIEPFWLKVERCDVTVGGLPADSPPIRVVVLADIQTDRAGPYERDVVARTLAEKPDLILLPGDFFQCSQQEFRSRRPEFLALLRALQAPYGVYACLGNVDRPRETAQLLADANVRLLRDEFCIVDVRGVRVAIGGVCRGWSRLEASELTGQMGKAEADVRLMMSHAPDLAMKTSATDKIDLIVAGHTHGGQVHVPGFGPLVDSSGLPRRVCGGGLHRVGDQQLYVSRGVGIELGQAPPVRLFCRPELAVLQLRGTGEAGGGSGEAATSSGSGG